MKNTTKVAATVALTGLVAVGVVLTAMFDHILLRSGKDDQAFEYGHSDAMDLIKKYGSVAKAKECSPSYYAALLNQDQDPYWEGFVQAFTDSDQE